MYYLGLTSYGERLPPGLALLKEGQIMAYVATDNHQCAQLRRTLRRVEQLLSCNAGNAGTAGTGLLLWSSQQQQTLETLLGRPLSAAAGLLHCQLELLGYPSLSPAYACARLGLNEPGEGALPQAYALAALHRHLRTLQTLQTLPPAPSGYRPRAAS